MAVETYGFGGIVGNFTAVHWMIVLGIVAVIWWSRARKKAVASQTSVPPPGATLPQPAYHWPSGDVETDVVGESHYQPALNQIAGLTDNMPAWLVPEVNNPHDKNAVRVDIAGKTVGYLSRDDAVEFRAKLRAKKLIGRVTTCDARLTGGGRLSYGVVLELDLLS